MNRLAVFTLRLFPALYGLVLVACGTTSVGAPVAETETDAVDTAQQTDASTDTAPDSAKPDVADATPDAKADAMADVQADAKADAAPDAAPDVAKADVVADVAQDTKVTDTSVADVSAPDGTSDAGATDGGPTVAGCGAGLIWFNNACSTTTAALHAGDGDSIATNTISLYLLPPNNLLVNPGAEAGDLSGWTTTDGGDPWQVGVGDAPFGGRYFRASYAWGYLAQTVDFAAAGISPTDLDAGIPLHFGVFGVGWGFPSSAGKSDTIKLDVAFQDASGTQIGTWSSGELALPIAGWGNVGVDTQTYPTGTRKAVVTIGSIDGEYWKGNYAATVDGANASAGALDIRISNADGTWTAWQPFTSVISNWSLTAGSGFKTVQIEFRDGNGVSLGIVTDTVTVQ